ncbi:CoA pyrophosphatase [Paracoccus pacificus]|uniref:CoA pyrophosphatase n=1 Tax=Paracoccus pacificus TaxID=1463598 RepID=A0ABW4R8Y2_9RHOB
MRALSIPALTERLSVALQRAAETTSDYELLPGMRGADTSPLRPAGVLAAFRPAAVPGGAELILTMRSSALRHHPGQIALPGGKVDAEDADEVAAALREAHEEIALPPDCVRVLGRLPTHETVTRFRVTPVLAVITREFNPRPEPGEVAEIFAVPLEHVAAVDRYRIEDRNWLGGRRGYRVLPFGPYYIWGATARMLHALAQRLD